MQTTSAACSAASAPRETLCTAVSEPSKPTTCTWLSTSDDVAIHDLKKGKRPTAQT